MLIEVIDTPDIGAGKTAEKRVITVQKPMMSSISSRPAFFHPREREEEGRDGVSGPLILRQLEEDIEEARGRRQTKDRFQDGGSGARHVHLLGCFVPP